MRPYQLSMVPANVNLLGYLSNATGVTWTLTANDSGDSLARRITIRNDAATDHSAKTYTMVGTDADGNAQTETGALPAGSATVTSTKYFLTLTSVTPSATIGADTMDIGWANQFITKTIPLDWRANKEATYAIDVTGTINYSVNESFSDVQNVANPAQNASWYALAALTTKTADLASAGTIHATAVQLVVASYTDTATIKLQIVQN